MVGIQCKSCGHRALVTPQYEPVFKMDHEIIAELSQRTLACGECKGSAYDLVRFSSEAADAWLKGSP